MRPNICVSGLLLCASCHPQTEAIAAAADPVRCLEPTTSAPLPGLVQLNRLPLLRWGESVVLASGADRLPGYPGTFELLRTTNTEAAVLLRSIRTDGNFVVSGENLYVFQPGTPALMSTCTEAGNSCETRQLQSARLAPNADYAWHRSVIAPHGDHELMVVPPGGEPSLIDLRTGDVRSAVGPPRDEASDPPQSSATWLGLAYRDDDDTERLPPPMFFRLGDALWYGDSTGSWRRIPLPAIGQIVGSRDGALIALDRRGEKLLGIDPAGNVLEQKVPIDALLVPGLHPFDASGEDDHLVVLYALVDERSPPEEWGHILVTQDPQNSWRYASICPSYTIRRVIARPDARSIIAVGALRDGDVPHVFTFQWFDALAWQRLVE